MTSVKDTQRVKCFGKAAQRSRHGGGAGPGCVYDGHHLFAGAAAAFGPQRHVMRAGVPHFQCLGDVIVEHHQIDAMVPDCGEHPVGAVNLVGFKAQLHAQIGPGAGAVGRDGGQQPFGKLRAALAAFPTPALGDPGGGDTVGRCIGISARKRHWQRERRRRAGGEMAFKRITVHVDDAGQDPVAGQVNRRIGPGRNPAVCNGDRPLGQLAVPQDSCTGQA